MMKLITAVLTALLYINITGCSYLCPSDPPPVVIKIPPKECSVSIVDINYTNTTNYDRSGNYTYEIKDGKAILPINVLAGFSDKMGYFIKENKIKDVVIDALFEQINAIRNILSEKDKDLIKKEDHERI